MSIKMVVCTRPQSDGSVYAFLKYRPIICAYGRNRSTAVDNLRESIKAMGGYRFVMNKGK